MHTFNLQVRGRPQCVTSAINKKKNQDIGTALYWMIKRPLSISFQ